MSGDATYTRIEEVSEGIIGVFTALLSVRNTLGDKILNIFLDKVPEKGEALWLRFKAFQKAKKDEGAQIEMNFGHFIASVIAPNLSDLLQ